MEIIKSNLKRKARFIYMLPIRNTHFNIKEKDEKTYIMVMLPRRKQDWAIFSDK